MNQAVAVEERRERGGWFRKLKAGLKGRWWETNAYAFMLILLSIVPLIVPETPPLPDLPGHMARYAVELYLSQSLSLQQFFEFHWTIVGNLGVDLLIIPVTKLFGLETSVKLIVIFTAGITTTGILCVAKQVHGRFPPSTALAIPFVYGFPFGQGFINFSLATGLSLLFFAYWMRLTARGANVARSILFVPISCLLWLTHIFGWAILGMLAFSYQLVVLSKQNKNPTDVVFETIKSLIPLSVPIIFAIYDRFHIIGLTYTGGFFNPITKADSLINVLRDRWMLWDCFSLAFVFVAIWAAYRNKKFTCSNELKVAVGVLAFTFVLLPSVIFGSAFADTRILPYIFIIGVLSIGRAAKLEGDNRQFALICALFLIVRIAGTCVSYFIADEESRERLTALNYFSPGARVLNLTGDACPRDWELPRYAHLGSFVVIRRGGFSNDQFTLPGAQLLRVKYAAAIPFQTDPSMFVYSQECIARARRQSNGDRPAGLTIAEALRVFPREAFDYVWILKPVGVYSPPPDLVQLWRGKDSIVFGVSRRKAR